MISEIKWWSHCHFSNVWQCYVSVKSKLQHPPPPPGHTPGHLTPLPSRGGGNLIIRVFQGVGNLIPMRWDEEFELHPRFHVKPLAWRAVMGDVVLEDFRGKDFAFMANWLQGLCRIWRYLNFNICNIGFRLGIYECILKVVFIMNYNTYTGDSIQQ